MYDTDYDNKIDEVNIDYEKAKDKGGKETGENYYVKESVNRIRDNPGERLDEVDEAWR